MIDTIAETICSRVGRLVHTILLGKQAATMVVGPDDGLVDAGLGSMDMVNLMLAVEAEFDLMIPATDITPRNFRSIASIATMVERVSEDGAV